MNAAQMGDGYLAAAAFEREAATRARAKPLLTKQERDLAEQLHIGRAMTHEISAQACFAAAGLDLDNRLGEVAGVTTLETAA